MSKLVCQMYGLRNEIAKDPFACFKKVKEIGFDKIQLDGMRGLDSQIIKQAIDEAGLIVDSMHIKHDRFIDGVAGIVEEGKLFNCYEVYLKYIEDPFQVEYGYKFTKYALIKATKLLNEAGFEVGFHSPEYDFNTLVDGMKVMDYICNEENQIAIHPEPDTYWLSVAGLNPLQYIRQYSNRILTIHLKDIDLSLDKNNMKENIRECGKGDVDFESIICWGYANGIRSFAIEQDYSKGDIFESMKDSLIYLQKLENKILSEVK